MQEKIIKIIAEKLDVDASKITMETRLVEDLGADSIDVVEMVMAFEDEFNISLPDEEIAKMKTVKDAIEYINSLIK